jgi:hypothetical protein
VGMGRAKMGRLGMGRSEMGRLQKKLQRTHSHMDPLWPHMRHPHGYPISYAIHMVWLPDATGPAKASILFLRTLTTDLLWKIHGI